MSRVAALPHVLLACGTFRAETRLAVIPVGNSGAENLADIVQLRLGQRKDVDLVERAAIKDILREQELQGAGRRCPRQTAALGKSLKADVWWCWPPAISPSRTSRSWCATQQGLRLRAQPLGARRKISRPMSRIDGQTGGPRWRSNEKINGKSWPCRLC